MVVAAAFLEGGASDDFRDEHGEAVVATGHGLDDLVDGAFVVMFEAAAEGVSEKFFGEAADEIVAFLAEEDGAEFGGGGEFFAGDEFAGGVDGGGAVLVAPGADGVKVFEAEADGVHAGVAGGADGVFAVLLHFLAEGAGELFLVGEFGDVGRRRGRGCAEKVFEDPFAAFDGRGAIGVGGEGENAGVGEEAAARGALEGDADEFVAGDAGDAVVAGEGFVEVGEVGVDEVEDAAVVADDGFDEQGGLAEHVVAEGVVELGEEFGVGGEEFEIAKLEPLAGEVLDESGGFRALKHAFDLGIELFAELALAGEGEEFVVWKAAPEKVGKAGGEGEFVDGMDGGGVVGLGLEFTTEKEVG